MKLYFSPLSCSLATRIAFYEAGASAEFVEIDPKTKKMVATGDDYREIYGLALVPALEMTDGGLLTENAAILQYVAASFPDAALAPTDLLGRARLQQWLCYIGTELHKALYVPLLDKKTAPEVKAYAREKGVSRLRWVNAHLEGREYLLDRFSVADGYLFTILHWSQVTDIDLKEYPALAAFMRRMHARPAVGRAVEEERPLYMQELARHKSA